MRPDVKRDKEKADVFMPEVRRALADHLILVGSVKQDREEGTDLVILRTEHRAVGVRVRELRFLSDYPFEVTIRSSRPSGAKTELDKLVDGWIDLIFYGFGDFETGRLVAWRIIDCRALRAQMIRGPELRFSEKTNRDQTKFRAYDVRSFAPGVEIQKWTAPQRKSA